jgi:hypothetical protein
MCATRDCHFLKDTGSKGPEIGETDGEGVDLMVLCDPDRRWQACETIGMMVSTGHHILQWYSPLPNTQVVGDDVVFKNLVLRSSDPTVVQADPTLDHGGYGSHVSGIGLTKDSQVAPLYISNPAGPPPRIRYNLFCRCSLMLEAVPTNLNIAISGI